nr:pre-mRNA splicing Prp18-interacting factor [Tanacetum cinerariifolium]
MSTFVLCVGCGTALYGFSPCQWCTCKRYGIDLRDGICPLCNSMNSCAYDSNPNSFDYPPDSYHPPHPTYETYSVTPSEPIDSLSMGDEHLDTISATESDEFIKSCVENLVLNPSESEGENVCDVPSCFTTFSNILFDDEYEFDSVDDQLLHNEEFSKKIFSNPLFEEEISSIKKNQITLMLSLIL